jgi:hypothetical protein
VLKASNCAAVLTDFAVFKKRLKIFFGDPNGATSAADADVSEPAFCEQLVDARLTHFQTFDYFFDFEKSHVCPFPQ